MANAIVAKIATAMMISSKVESAVAINRGDRHKIRFAAIVRAAGASTLL